MTLQDLDFLLLKTEKVKEEIHSLEYDKADVRHSFFCLFYTIVYDYYLGQVSYTLSKLMSQERVLFHEQDTGFSNHFSRITQIARIELMELGYFGTLNRNVILNSWTAFELSLSDIFNTVCSDSVKNKLIVDLNHKIIKVTKDLSPENKEIVINSLTKSTFIPLLRKFRSLVNKAMYKRDYKKDLEFLSFLNSYRNSMLHSNGIYYGKGFKYEFNGVMFEFVDQEMFKETNHYPYVYWDMTFELKSIFKALINCVSYDELIEYKSKL